MTHQAPQSTPLLVCAGIRNDMLKRQHAFRKRHSWEIQLTTAINDWVKILDKGGQVDTFILDFEKAFDTLPHELLTRKLFGYDTGRKTLRWIDSFLCYRTQRAVANGETSVWAPGLSGIPQGTVLDPLLFSIQIWHFNVKSCFLGKVRKNMNFSSLKLARKVVKVKIHLFSEAVSFWHFVSSIIFHSLT